MKKNIKKSGDWLYRPITGKAKFQILVFLLFLAFAACNRQEETIGEHDHSASGTTYTCPMHPQVVKETPGSCPICGMDLVAVTAGDSDSPALMLSESQILLANIRFQEAGTGSRVGGTVLTGRVTQNEDLAEVISSRVPGRIERLYIKETGARIREGQPLYDIYSEELLTYQQEYLLALEQYEQLGEEEPRYASFAESARRRLKLYGMSDAAIRELGTRKKGDAKITFLSPATGVVTNISAVEGQYVQEGSRLYSLAKLDPLWVEAELYRKDLDRVKEGMKVAVQLEGLANPVEGKVTFISPEFRSDRQIVTLRTEIPNPGGKLIPGMQANVLLPPAALEGDQKEQMVLPVESVIRDQHGAHVWILTGENTFEPRKVVTSEATGGEVVITEGLQPDEKVVTSGAYLLYSEFVLKKGGNPLKEAVQASGNHAGKGPEQSGRGEEAEPVFKRKEFALAFAHYQELKEALVSSSAEKAKEQAAALQLALKGMKNAKAAAEYAGRIAGAATSDEQRDQFFFLNNNFIELAEEEELLSGQLYVQFCPMANQGQGAYWLSPEEEIRNPYLPENMLSCGEVKSVIQ